MPKLGYPTQEHYPRDDRGGSAALQLIDESRRESAAKEEARDWQLHPFTMRLMKLMVTLEAKAHYDARVGAITWERYAGAWDALSGIYCEADRAIRDGLRAEERLEQWSADGTLSEAELTRTTARE